MNNELEEGLYYDGDSDGFVYNMIFDNETSAIIYLSFEEVEQAVKKDLPNILKRTNNICIEKKEK